MYTLFTRENCNFCEMAKNYLRENDVLHVVLNLAADKEKIDYAKSFIPEELKRGPVFLPIVLDEYERYIGGFEQLIKHHQNPLNRQNLINALRGNVCTIHFTKLNGEERIMVCTLIPSKVPNFERKNLREENLDTIIAYDVEMEGWRSFYVDRVKKITIGA